MAHASPYCIKGCSQFIVEFAGDFLIQDNDATHTNRFGHSQYGDVNGPGSDGQIDYVVVGGVKQISWYGLPRSTSGNAKISALNGDVAPLRDRFQVMYSPTTGAPMAAPYNLLPVPTGALATMVAQGYPTFEKVGPRYQPLDYSKNIMSVAEAQAGYTCAFGPNSTTDPRPKLIRIPITLDDPSGRLPDGQTYQYVFPVP